MLLSIIFTEQSVGFFSSCNLRQVVHTRLFNSVRKFQGASRVEPRPGELDVALELEAPPLGVLVQLVEEVVALHVTPLEGAVRYWD